MEQLTIFESLIFHQGFSKDSARRHADLAQRIASAVHSCGEIEATAETLRFLFLHLEPEPKGPGSPIFPERITPLRYHYSARREGRPGHSALKRTGALWSMKYQPMPIDTSSVTLTKEIEELTELLAENAHDLWAQQRLSDGWTYGPHRNDGAKQHPCLRPYSELPEQEKEYDRRAALGALKAILALGYRIER
jgi:hypothetical protein